MKASVFPDTSGDVILALKQHDDGSVTLDAVAANGSTPAFAKLLEFVDGGGHVETHSLTANAAGLEYVDQHLKVTPV